MKGTILPEEGAFGTNNLPRKIATFSLKGNELSGKLDLTDLPSTIMYFDIEGNRFTGDTEEAFLGKDHQKNNNNNNNADDDGLKQDESSRSSTNNSSTAHSRFMNIRNNALTGIVSRRNLPRGWMIMGDTVKN